MTERNRLGYSGLRGRHRGLSGRRFYRASILVVAFALRLSAVWIVVARYPRDWLFNKAPDLSFLANSLVSGRGLSSPFGGSTGPSAFLAPGYPALLALLFHWFGAYSLASAGALISMQTIFALLTVALVMWIAGEISGGRTAVLAGLIWAVSPPIVWLPVVPWETSLSTLLLTGMVALALRCVRSPMRGIWVAMGAYCALAMLVNPSLMLAFFCIAGWAVYRSHLPSGWPPLFGAVVWALLFLPWPLRNARVLHSFIPLRSNLGYELWQGNHPGGDGFFNQAIEPLNNRKEFADYAARGEVAYMRHKTELAERFIAGHPGRFAFLCAKRFCRFWAGAGAQVNYVLIEAHIGLMSALGLAGLWLLFQQNKAAATLLFLPLVVFPLPYYVTHPDFRFRVVLDPLLTVLAASTVLRVCARVKRSNAARAGAMVGRTHVLAGDGRSAG